MANKEFDEGEMDFGEDEFFDETEGLDPLDMMSNAIESGKTFNDAEIRDYMRHADAPSNEGFRKGSKLRSGSRRKIEEKDQARTITLFVAKENEAEIRELRTKLFNDGIIEKDSLNDLGLYGLNLVRMIYSTGNYMILPTADKHRRKIDRMGRAMFALNEIKIPKEYQDENNNPRLDILRIYAIHRALDLAYVYIKVEAKKMEEKMK
jgi:hypothetical protein